MPITLPASGVGAGLPTGSARTWFHLLLSRGVTGGAFSVLLGLSVPSCKMGMARAPRSWGSFRAQQVMIFAKRLLRAWGTRSLSWDRQGL